MERIDFGALPQLPWKNGGGTTRALAENVDAEGRLLWRFSLADIDRDGPFSVFPGLHRLHVIVRGAGLTLSAQDLEITARPSSPIALDGETPFNATLTDSPCQAVNVIFDKARIAAEVTWVTQGTWRSEGAHSLILCLAGSATLDTPRGDVAGGQFIWIRGPARLTAPRAAQLVSVQLTDQR